MLTTSCFSSSAVSPLGQGRVALGSQCCSVSKGSRDAQHSSPDSQAPLRAELFNSGKNKLLSCLISSPELLVVPCCIYCSTHGILVGKDLWGSSKSSVSQLTRLTLGKLSTAFTEVLGESDWCLGWEEDGEMGRTVPSSSEQLDLLSCSGEWALQVAALLQKNGQVFFSLLPGKQRRAQRERGFRTLVCGASDRTVFFSIALKGLVLKSSFFYKEPDLFLRDGNSPGKHIFIWLLQSLKPLLEELTCFGGAGYH